MPWPASSYFVIFGQWLLPDRRPAITTHDDPREYTVEMMVLADGPLVDKSIEEAGLRHLPGLFLARIDRAGEEIAPVSPRERLHGGDHLVFVGVFDSVVDLHEDARPRPCAGAGSPARHTRHASGD